MPVTGTHAERVGGDGDDPLIDDERHGNVATPTEHERVDRDLLGRARGRAPDATRVREGMTRHPQFLTGCAERREHDVFERAAREPELAEQPEHERHHRRRVGGEEVEPTDLLERVTDVDARLCEHTANGALEDVEGVGVDGRRVSHGASRAPGRPGSGAGSRRNRRRSAPSG